MRQKSLQHYGFLVPLWNFKRRGYQRNLLGAPPPTSLSSPFPILLAKVHCAPPAQGCCFITVPFESHEIESKDSNIDQRMCQSFGEVYEKKKGIIWGFIKAERIEYCHGGAAWNGKNIFWGASVAYIWCEWDSSHHCVAEIECICAQI